MAVALAKATAGSSAVRTRYYVGGQHHPIRKRLGRFPLTKSSYFACRNVPSATFVPTGTHLSYISRALYDDKASSNTLRSHAKARGESLILGLLTFQREAL